MRDQETGLATQQQLRTTLSLAAGRPNNKWSPAINPEQHSMNIEAT